MRGVFAALFAGCLIAQPAAATEDMMRYLRNEPVTLMDWGLVRLKADLIDAASAGVDRIGDGEHRAGAYYDVARERLVAYLTLATRYDLRTEENCRAAYRRLVDHLTLGAPGGVGASVWYLESVFGHAARRGAGQPQDFGERLVENLRFEVALRAREVDKRAGDWMRVSCSGALNSDVAALETERSGAIQ